MPGVLPLFVDAATVLLGSGGASAAASCPASSSSESACASWRRICLGGAKASRSELRLRTQAAESQRPEQTRLIAYPMANREGPICSISGRPTALNALLAKRMTTGVVSGRTRLRKKLDPRPLSGSCCEAVKAKIQRMTSARRFATNGMALDPLSCRYGVETDWTTARLLNKGPARNRAKMAKV